MRTNTCWSHPGLGNISYMIIAIAIYGFIVSSYNALQAGSITLRRKLDEIEFSI